MRAQQRNVRCNPAKSVWPVVLGVHDDAIELGVKENGQAAVPILVPYQHVDFAWEEPDGTPVLDLHVTVVWASGRQAWELHRDAVHL